MTFNPFSVRNPYRRTATKVLLWSAELALAYIVVNTMFPPVYKFLLHSEPIASLFVYTIPAVIALMALLWHLPQFVSVRFRMWIVAHDAAHHADLRNRCRSMSFSRTRRELWVQQANDKTWPRAIKAVPLFILLYSGIGSAILHYHLWHLFGYFGADFADINLPLNLVVSTVLTLAAAGVFCHRYINYLDGQ